MSSIFVSFTRKAVKTVLIACAFKITPPLKATREASFYVTKATEK